MKTSNFILFAILLFMGLSATAQVPQSFNYQAVAKDNFGTPLANQKVKLKFSILAESPKGATVYSETHVTETNASGLLNVVIGEGNVESGAFKDITWGSGEFFLSVTLNEVDLGTTMFLSVPYAIMAEKTAPREHVITIPAQAFQPNYGSQDYTSSIEPGGIQINTNPAIPALGLVAPVILPDGAIIKELTVYYKDNSDADLFVLLLGEPLLGETFSIGSNILASSGASDEWKSVTKQENLKIKNNIFGYFIRVGCSNWSFEGEKSIKGVKIKYIY